MPMHEFRCSNCGTKVTVMRRIGEHDKKPQDGEVEDNCTEEVVGPLKHSWTKVITSTPTTNFADGWSPLGIGGGKGHW